jgi:hypothetical protein
LFADVHRRMPDNWGFGASELTAAVVEPVKGKKRTIADAGPGITILVDGTVRLTILVRNQDPETLDDLAEQLLDAAEDAIDGQSLGELTFPDKTILGEWTWEKPSPPERRITATVTYQYERDGWDSSDTTP